MFMSEFYTPDEAAIGTIEERRESIDIRSRVLEYLGDMLPSTELEQGKPVAILARYVPRATKEDELFINASYQAGFRPFWASYRGDRFTTRNPEKVETIRPPILWRKGQKTRAWVVEPEKRIGGVGELTTIYGNTSSQFQQNIREMVFDRRGTGEIARNTFDMGNWYMAQAPRFGHEKGGLAQFYYPALMALATTYCVIYEDFDGGPNADSGDLKRFRHEVVYPAFKKVQKDLGLTPIIIQLPYRPQLNNTDLSFLSVDEQKEFLSTGCLPIEPLTD